MIAGSQQWITNGAQVALSEGLWRTRKQSFCGDPEGWGPVSSVRYDFTPCFVDVWIVFVAIWGIVGGAGATWFLLKRRSSQPVSRDWHFYIKLVHLGRTNLLLTLS